MTPAARVALDLQLTKVLAGAWSALGGMFKEQTPEHAKAATSLSSPPVAREVAQGTPAVSDPVVEEREPTMLEVSLEAAQGIPAVSDPVMEEREPTMLEVSLEAAPVSMRVAA